MDDYKSILRNWRILLLIGVVLISILAIAPQPWVSGAAIRIVEKGSAAELGGIIPPAQSTKPVDRERVIAINNREVKTVEDYISLSKNLEPNRTITVKTNKATYRLVTQPLLNGTNETKQVDEIVLVNQTINGSIVLTNKTVKKNVTIQTGSIIGVKPLGLKVYDVPTTNIRTGLDLQGGTRVILQPEKRLEKEDLQTLIQNMKQRLNVYGLSDIVIKESGDLSGNQSGKTKRNA